MQIIKAGKIPSLSAKDAPNPPIYMERNETLNHAGEPLTTTEG